MEEILVRIAAYQKAMGYNFKDMTAKERMAQFRDYMAALVVEQGELASELPFKPWRKIEDQPWSSEEVVAEEWVDCLFFLVDQALVLQLSPETVRKAFEDKMDRVMARIHEGYGSAYPENE